MKNSGIDPPGEMVPDLIGLPRSPIMAFTPGVRFGFALAKYAVADCPPRLAVMASKCDASYPDPMVKEKDCCAWPRLSDKDAGIDTALSLPVN